MRGSIDRFLFKHRNSGIKRLMLYIIVGQIAVFVLGLTGNMEVVSLLTFNPALMLRGEVWRILTALLVPYDFSFFFVFFTLFYYWVSTSLESIWGTLKLNLYLLTGVLFVVAYGFILLWHFTSSLGSVKLSDLPPEFTFSVPYHDLFLTLFLALATLCPDEVINLFGIVPIKLKWLAIIDLGFLLLPILRAPTSPGSYLGLMFLGNYLLYFGASLVKNFSRSVKKKAKTTSRAIPFKAAVKQAKQTRGYTHKCAECGVTDADSPGTEFRYCSLCSGYQCYCSAHIFSHEHRKG